MPVRHKVDSGFAIPQSLSHHEYSHRLMRLLGIVHTIETTIGYPRDEFLIRSCMMCNILVADHYCKLDIEAGTLSFIPQYCPWGIKENRKNIRKCIVDNFGKDRADLLEEVENLRMCFVKDEEENIEGHSVHAKDIYAIHVYLDLINMTNPCSYSKVIDGILYGIVNEGSEQFVVMGSDKISMTRFYAYLISMSEFKLTKLGYYRANIRQSIVELCKELKRTKGVEIEYKEMKEQQ
jgi:hypothetical protein